jgi:hypothetical protein
MTRKRIRKGKGTTDTSNREIEPDWDELDRESAEWWEGLLAKFPGIRMSPERSAALDKYLRENPVSVIFPNIPVKEQPHCPQEKVKSLRNEGIRVKLPGPLEERLQNDLMMEGWRGKRQKDNAAPTLYYTVSPVNGGLVFATPYRAEYVSRIYNALGAKTWGELKERLPSAEYDDIVCSLFDDNGEPRPQGSDTFDSSDVPGYCDGIYPDWLQEEMPGTVPDEILNKYGSYEMTSNGAYFHIEPKYEEAICKDLRALGINVVRRDDLYFC